MPDEIQKILQELKQGLRKIYGEKLKAVILFGSYARGDAHPPDSDIDVMVVLKGEFDRNQMSSLCDYYVADLSLEYDVVISVRVASEMQYALSKFPLYINVRWEGVAI
jgi:predicted nucleotidyltransferase